MVFNFNKSFPMVMIKNRSDSPWFTKGLRIASKNMRCLHYIRKYFLSNVDFIAYFNKYRMIFRNTIRLAKQLYSSRLNKSISKSGISFVILQGDRLLVLYLVIFSHMSSTHFTAGWRLPSLGTFRRAPATLDLTLGIFLCLNHFFSFL